MFPYQLPKKQVMIEIWKQIKGYDEYQVSNLGRVKSKYRVLTATPTDKGYLRVNITKKGKSKSFRVHRLVAEAFIPNPDNKPQVDHINTDRTDNRVENLRWVTGKENCSNPITSIHNSQRQVGDKNCMYGKFGKSNHSSKPVIQYTDDGYMLRKWYSISDIERELGIHTTQVSGCCRGNRKSAGGYLWKYWTIDDWCLGKLYNKMHKSLENPKTLHIFAAVNGKKGLRDIPGTGFRAPGGAPDKA